MRLGRRATDSLRDGGITAFGNGSIPIMEQFVCTYQSTSTVTFEFDHVDLGLFNFPALRERLIKNVVHDRHSPYHMKLVIRPARLRPPPQGNADFLIVGYALIVNVTRSSVKMRKGCLGLATPLPIVCVGSQRTSSAQQSLTTWSDQSRVLDREKILWSVRWPPILCNGNDLLLKWRL